MLDDSIQLERALTDPSRPVADKVAVLKELLGDNAHPMTMEIMTDLVSRRWSRARDIANAVEDFGVDAMMYYADATDATLQVSIELSELHSALLNLPVVRAKLYDYQATSEARVKLFREVFSGKTLNKVTMRLAEHATCNLRRRRYLETIQWLINKFSRHMGESMVTVTTATPLKKRKDRITALLHRNIPDQLLNQDCFSDARAAKQTDFSALGIRRQKINNLDARLQNLRDRALILKWRRIPVNTPVLLTIQLLSSIYRLT